MNKVLSFLDEKMYKAVLTLNINFVLCLLSLILIYFMIKLYKKAKYVDLLLNREIHHKEMKIKRKKEFKDRRKVSTKSKEASVKSKGKPLFKAGLIETLGVAGFKNKLTILLTLKNKSEHIKTIYSVFIFGLVAIGLSLLRVKQLFLAVVIPAIIYIMVLQIMTEMIYDFDYVVRRNFSHLVNSLVKHFSKYNNLSVILYESSKEMKDEELSSLLVNLSREMIVDNDESGLINCIEKSNNLWLDSLLLTLVNYKEKGSKDHTIQNLLRLSELVDKKNSLLAKMVSDRKPVVIINYMVLIVAIAIFIGNLILNPIMKEFLISGTGKMSLIVGLICMFLTVIINMKLTKE